MSGTQTFVILLVLIVGVLTLMFLALRSRTPATAEITIGKAASVKLSLSPSEKEKAAQAVGEAAQARGQSSDDAAASVTSRLSAVDEVPATLVLWVDDHPENNVLETIALMHLGVRIVVATSNDMARRYLAEFPFDLVITDLGRGADLDNGKALLRELRANRPELATIVYTADAGSRSAQLPSAAAVEDQPGGLIDAVLSLGAR